MIFGFVLGFAFVILFGDLVDLISRFPFFLRKLVYLGSRLHPDVRLLLGGASILILVLVDVNQTSLLEIFLLGFALLFGYAFMFEFGITLAGSNAVNILRILLLIVGAGLVFRGFINAKGQKAKSFIESRRTTRLAARIAKLIFCIVAVLCLPLYYISVAEVLGIVTGSFEHSGFHPQLYPEQRQFVRTMVPLGFIAIALEIYLLHSTWKLYKGLRGKH